MLRWVFYDYNVNHYIERLVTKRNTTNFSL